MPYSNFKYYPNNDYLTDASGNFFAGLERHKVSESLLEDYNRIDVNGDGVLSLQEVTEEARRDVKGIRKGARNDLFLSAFPVLLGVLGRKVPGAIAVCSLFALTGCVSAGFKFYAANRFEKDIEKFTGSGFLALT